MACTLTTKAKIKSMALNVMRAALAYPQLAADTEFGDPPLGLSSQAKALIYFPLRDAVEAHGCMLKKFSPIICGNSGTPADIIAAITSDLGVKT